MNLRQKEKLFKPKDLATKFAMWFVVNWEWHDDTEKGAKYLSIYDGKTVKCISPNGRRIIWITKK